MNYISTRNNQKNFTFKDVFLKGLADDGGLFIPKSIKQFKKEELNNLNSLSYNDLAAEIIYPFIGDFMSKDKRDKRSKVKARAKNIANIRKSKEQEVQKMDRLAQKAAGSSLSPEDKKELGRLRSKYSDLVKKRASKMNSRPQRGG